MKHPILKKRTSGGEGVAAASLDVALEHRWDFDAYIVQYTGDRRLNKAGVATTPMQMAVELYDFDRKDAPDLEREAWANNCLDALPLGFQGYRTAGGFRAVVRRATPFIVNDPVTWEAWRAYHAGRAQALGALVGAEPDEATDDPGRLFRLPDVVREDGKPCYPELVGTLGTSDLVPLPVAPRPATDTSSAEALATFLGALFAQLGGVVRDEGAKLTVQCPWASEHSAGGDSLAVVYSTDDGLGKFHCGHTHCKGRDTADVIEKRQGLAPELYARWLLTSPPARDAGEPLSQPVKASNSFPLMTAEEMVAGDEPIPWVVEGLLSVGEPTLVVGGAGSGKTSAMVALALAVTSGGDVWGKFPTRRQGPVVHIDYEQGKTLRRTYLAFAKGLGLDAAALVREGALRIATLPREQLLDANVTDKHLSVVGSEILALCRDASVCVINSLTAGTNKVNENDAKIAAVFNLLARISELTGCAFIVLHHSGRGERKGARGSSAIDGAVQTTFEIDHKRGQAFTVWKHTKDRPAGGLQEPFRLTWTNEAGVQRLSAETIVEEKPAPGAERPEDRIAKAILFVMENRGLSGKTRILECVGGKQTIKITVFNDLIVKGLIEHVGSRYVLAAGVRGPREQPDGVREWDE